MDGNHTTEICDVQKYRVFLLLKDVNEGLSGGAAADCIDVRSFLETEVYMWLRVLKSPRLSCH